jgi:hypothetical protein
MKKIKALTNFGGQDTGRSGKLVVMAEGDEKDVSDEFAQDVIQAGQAELVKEKKAKV